MLNGVVVGKCSFIYIRAQMCLWIFRSIILAEVLKSTNTLRDVRKRVANVKWRNGEIRIIVFHLECGKLHHRFPTV